MNSRMDKYENKTRNVESRSSKNQKLYNEDMNINVEYIDLSKPLDETADKEKIRSRVATINYEEALKLPEEATNKEERLYDINEILKKVKENKKEEAKSTLINTEYNILTKLDLDKVNLEDEGSREKVEKIINDAYPKKEREETALQKEEELFDSLIDEKTLTELTAEIKTNNEESLSIMEEDEKDKVQEENVVAVKENVENFKKVEENNLLDTTSTTDIIKQEKKSKVILIVIIFIVILLLLAAAYLVLKYFGTI